MSTTTDGLDDFLAGLPELRVAPPRPTRLGQKEKVRRLAGPILSRLYRDGTCRIDELEAEAPSLGISGRLAVTLGRGVGSKGGMNLFLDGGQVMLCQNNAKVCIDGLDREWLAVWLSDNGVSVGRLETWFKQLPAV